MAVDGKWKIAMQTPMGTREATLTLASDGGALSGTMSGDAGSIDIYDAKVSGDQATFKVDITQPMALTLEFTANISGDSLAGSVTLGMFGDAPLSGNRA